MRITAKGKLDKRCGPRGRKGQLSKADLYRTHIMSPVYDLQGMIAHCGGRDAFIKYVRAHFDPRGKRKVDVSAVADQL